MKVLIVSHLVMSQSSNMGKTLLSYFQDFHPDEISQFYIRQEIPTDGTVCQNYYRFTDTDALKSILPFSKRGCALGKEDIDDRRADSWADTELQRKIYRYGTRRTGFIHMARNLVWTFSHWFTEDLKKWIDQNSPDVVFLASGDYGFTYTIAEKIAKYRNIPLVISCVDDFYLYNINQNTVIGRADHALFMKTVRRVMDSASHIFCICDLMAEHYQKLFDRPVTVLHTAAVNRELPFQPSAEQISYIGNLGYSRYKQLIAIGQVLKAMDRHLDVYSGTQDPEVLALMTEENGICFHGQITAKEVCCVMENSMAVIHTESFEPSIMERVRFSVSTKIAESLMYGPCLFAYGPEGIASMDYLRQNHAAYVVTKPEMLADGLAEFLGSPEIRQQILYNARDLARKNHTLEHNAKTVRSVLEEVIRSKGTAMEVSSGNEA